MSLLRIISLRRFGDFQKIFATKAIFPETKVEPEKGFENYIKIDKLRKKRL